MSLMKIQSFLRRASRGFVILSVFLASGCASLQQKWDDELSQNREKKEFQIRKVWVRDTLSHVNTGYRKINRMTPLIYKNLVIQGNSIDGVVAYNQETGQKEWSFSIYEGVEPTAALFKDSLYIAANDGYFYSLKAQTGDLNWKIQTQTENLGEPFYDSSEGIIYFQTGLNSLYAVEAESGRIIWTYARQDTSQFSIRGNSKPALYRDYLFAGFSDGSLVALNKKSGTVAWEIFLNRNKRFRDIDSSPVLDGDLIYIQAFDDQLYCVSAANGSVQWKTDFGGYDGLLIHQDTIYASTTDSQVVALNKNNGQVKWKYTSKNGLPTKPVVFQQLIVFGESQGSLVFLDQVTGKQIGEFSPGRGIMAAPAIFQNTEKKSDRKKGWTAKSTGLLYFISGEGNLYSLEAGWKRRRWLD